MKKAGLLCLLLLCSFSFQKKKPFVPPGTVQITEKLFADISEISNFSWLEYMYHTGMKYGGNSPEYKSVIPDTSVWHHQTPHAEMLSRLYLRHPRFREFPVVGITRSQAQAFCKWRTQRVKEFYAIRYKKELNINYRLPTKEEWEFLADNVSPVLRNRGRNEKGIPLLNSRDVSIADTVPTKSVNTFEASRFGLYNLLGNVAEMIQNDSIVKGGSWKHSIIDCRPGKDLVYSGTSAWLGFRCVRELED